MSSLRHQRDEDVKDIAVGDELFGVCEVDQEGTYAEKIAVKAATVAKKPSDLSHDYAAALALTGLTGLSAIEDTLKLQRGETILIQVGAGGAEPEQARPRPRTCRV
jgi:NADPH:quinone reductase-like Zn-dependent oxidoreductase